MAAINNLIEKPSSQEMAFGVTFLSELKNILGIKLYSFYLYGAVMFTHPITWRVDFDYHIILHSALSESETKKMRDLYEELRKSNPLGEELDGYCILLESARLSVCPKDQVLKDATDKAWALHRVHIHAERFLSLYGEDSRQFLPVPKWSELEDGLKNEFDFIKKHPQYPQFGILNLSRLIYSWSHRDVVISKYESAQWALSSLESRWHPAIRAAQRDYEQKPERGDAELLKETFPDFLTFTISKIEKLKLELKN